MRVNAPLTYSMRGPGGSNCASVMMMASLALSTAAFTSAMPPSSERRASGTGEDAASTAWEEGSLDIGETGKKRAQRRYCPKRLTVARKFSPARRYKPGRSHTAATIESDFALGSTPSSIWFIR